MTQNQGMIQDRFHALRIGGEIGAQVATVK
jgi:hypothetical protein